MKKLSILVLLCLSAFYAHSQCTFDSTDIGVSVTTPSTCGGTDGGVVITLPASGGGTCYDLSSVSPSYDCADSYDDTINSNGTYYVNNGETVVVKGPFEGNIDINSGTLVVCGDVTINNQINLTGNDKLVVLGDLTVAALSLTSSGASIENYGSITLYYESSSSYGSIQVNDGLVKNYGSISTALDFSLNTTDSYLENYNELLIGTELSQQGHLQNNVRGSWENYGSITTHLNLQLDAGGILKNYCQLHCMRSMYLTNQGLFESYGLIDVASELYLRNTVTIGGNALIVANKLVLENLNISNTDNDCALLKGVNELRIQNSAVASGPMSICGEENTYELHLLQLSGGAVQDCQCTADGDNGFQSSSYSVTWPDGSTQEVRTDLVSGDYDVTVSDGSCSITFTVSVPTLSIGLDYMVQGTSCDNTTPEGTLSFAATDAQAPVSYSLNGLTVTSPTPIGVGTHTLTATDANNCSTSQTFSLAADDLSGCLDVDVVTSAPSSCGGHDGSASVHVNLDDCDVVSPPPPTGGCYDVSGVMPAYSCAVSDYQFVLDGNSGGGGGQHYAQSGTTTLVSGPFTGKIFVEPNATLVTCGEVKLEQDIILEAGAKLINLGKLEVTAIVLRDVSSRLENFDSLTVLYETSSSWGNFQVDAGLVTNYGTIVLPFDFSLNTASSQLINNNELLVGTQLGVQEARQINVRGYLENNGNITTYRNLQVDPGGRMENNCTYLSYVNGYLTDADVFTNNGRMTFSGEFYLRGTVSLGEGSSLTADRLVLEDVVASNGEIGCALLKGVSVVDVQRGNTYSGPISVNGAISVCTEGSYGINFDELDLLGGAVADCQCQVVPRLMQSMDEVCEVHWTSATGVSSTGSERDDLMAGTYEVVISCTNGCQKTATVEVPQSNVGGPSMQVSTEPSQSDVCTGQIDLVSVSGGTAPYSYALNMQSGDFAFGDLCAGSYTVSVVDSNGCEGDVIVTVPLIDTIDCSGLDVTVSLINEVSAGNCDGSYEAVVSGNVGTLSYTWYNEAEEELDTTSTLTNLCADAVYFVQVVDGSTGCMRLKRLDLSTAPCGKEIGIDKQDVSCAGANDGRITVAVAGGLGGVSGQCDASPSVIESCSNCDQLLSGNVNLTLTDGQKYCVAAGAQLSGNLTVDNGVVSVCGTLNNVNVTLRNGGVFIHNGAGQVNYLNIENGASGYFSNYGTLSVNTLNMYAGAYNNYGTLTINSWNSNNSASLSNYCTLSTTNQTSINGGSVFNGGSITFNGNVNLNAGSGYELSGGSETMVNASLNAYTNLTGTGGASALIINGVANGSGQVSGQVQVCGSNNLGLVNGATHVGSCDNINLGCEVVWLDAFGTIVGEGTSRSNLSAGMYIYRLDCGDCNFEDTVYISEPSVLTITPSDIKAASCAEQCDGSIGVAVSGGRPIYYYNWDNGFSRQSLLSPGCAGDHVLEVEDSRGCKASTTITIPIAGTGNCPCQTGGIPLSMSGTDASGEHVADGSATATPQSPPGVAPYYYSWSPDNKLQGNVGVLDSVLPGAYKVLVIDDQGCKGEDSVIIGHDNGIDCGGFAAELHVDSVPQCPKSATGVLRVTTSNGIADYSYRWIYEEQIVLTAATALYDEALAGDYRVVVRDSRGCEAEATKGLDYESENCGGGNNNNGSLCDFNLGLTINNVVDAPCNQEPEGSMHINVSNGSSPFAYSWYGLDYGVNGQEPNWPLNRYEVNQLRGDDYLVYVIDGDSCSGVERVRIEGEESCHGCESFDVVLTTQEDLVTANNNSASITISDDGAQDYLYRISWSNGAYGTTAISNQGCGIYEVTVAQYGPGGITGNPICELSRTFEFDCIPPPDDCSDLSLSYTVSKQVAGPGFAGGSWIDVQVTGGTGMNSYLWSNQEITEDISVQQPGDYTVIVTSDTCVDSLTVTISDDVCVPAVGEDCCEPLICACIENPQNCEDIDFDITHVNCAKQEKGSINLIVHHFGVGGPYYFLWDGPNTTAHSENIAGREAGNYYVTIYDKDYNSIQLGPLEILDESPSTCIDEDTCGGRIISLQDLPCDQGETGKLSLIVSHGKGPFTYSWTKDGESFNQSGQDVTGLGVGSYVVSVADDNGCSFTESYTIMGPGTSDCCPNPEDEDCPACEIIPSSRPTGCPGLQEGSAQVQIIGGIAPKVSWDIPAEGPSVINLEAGVYKAIITDEGNPACQGSKEIKVLAVYDPKDCGPCQDFDPGIERQSGSDCSLAGTTLMVSQQADYYYWSTGETTRSIVINSPGTYEVEVWRYSGINGEEKCIRNIKIVINEDNSDFTIDNGITADGEYLCAGGSVNLYAPLVPNAAYEWFPNGGIGRVLEVTQAGRYWVRITRGECELVSTDYDLRAAPDDVEIIGGVDSICTDSPVSYTIYASTGTGTIRWYYNGTYAGNNQTFKVQQPGTYSLEVTYPGCASQQATLTVEESSDCDSIPITCDPRSVFMPIDPEDISDCKSILIDEAVYNANEKYRTYINGLKIDFQNNYLNHCLATNESMTMQNQSGEAVHHYTLYYYDQGGNLVRTVPPEGVRPLNSTQMGELRTQRASNQRANVFPQHRYATTYTYNSLNQLIGQSVPDHDLMQRYSEEVSTPNEANTTWNGATVAGNGNGLLYGTDQNDQTGVLYYTTDGGKSWQSLENIGIGNLYTAYVVDANLMYAAGESGTVVRNQNGVWTILSIGSNEGIEYLSFFGTGSTGYAITAAGHAYSTTDAGTSWQQVAGFSLDEVVGMVSGIGFVDADHGVLSSSLGDRGYVYTTADGGLNWQEEQINNLGREPQALAVANGQSSVAGNSGLLLQQERGSTYSQVASGHNQEDFEDIAMTGNELFVDNGSEWLAIDRFNGQERTLDTYYEAVYKLESEDELYGLTGNTLRLLNDNQSSNEINLSNTPAGLSLAGTEQVCYWIGSDLYVHDAGTERMISGPWTTTAITNLYGRYERTGAFYELLVTTATGWYYNSYVPMDNGEPLGDWATTTISDDVRQISFATDDEGILVGASNIYRSSDGGVNWQVLSANNEGFEELAFTASKLTGIANGTLYVYDSEGGWQEESLSITPLPITDMALRKTSTNTDYQVYFAGTAGQLLSLDYNGVNYQLTDEGSGMNEDLQTIGVSSQDDVVAVGVNGTRVYSSGAGWLINSSDSQAGQELVVSNSNNVLLATADDVYGGATTGTLLSVGGINRKVNALDLSESGSLMQLAVGDGGFIATSTGGAFSPLPQLATPQINDAVISASGRGYAVGAQGTIIKTIDGGRNWTIQSSGTTEILQGVAIYDNNKAAVVGVNSWLYTTNGGANWMAIPLPASTTLEATAFINNNKVYAVGEAGGLYSYNLSNNTFSDESIIAESANTLRDITFVDSKVGYLCGDGNAVYKLDLTTGLPGWQAVKPDDAGDWYTVDFVDREIGYVSGEDNQSNVGVVLKTINGGEGWNNNDDSQLMPSGEPVLSISTQSRTEGVVVTANQVVKMTDMRDRFSGLFWYDELGRLVLSQNTKQYEKQTQDPYLPAYSYTFYDHLGRIIEVGEVFTDQQPLGLGEASGENTSFNISEGYVREFVESGLRTEVTRTYYDTLHPQMDAIEAHYATLNDAVDFTSSTLRNRVAATSYTDAYSQGVSYDFDPLAAGNYEYATFYSYDIHGNVHTLVQDNPAFANYPLETGSSLTQRYKRVDYDYDLVSGNVNEVAYQRGQKDAFYHRYSYDADNRIEEVETSEDRVIWEHQATYDYYRHGPLMRSVCGDLRVQGCDYAYTLHGWLKAVNGNNLAAGTDIGEDGTSTTGVLKDEFGFQLNYYAGDYKTIGTQTYTGSELGGAVASESEDLFNGNISSRVTAIAHFMKDNNSAPSVFGYKYDQLNRLKTSTYYEGTNTDLSNTVQNDAYGVALNYDANGNIMSLNRTADEGESMDQLEYHYDRPGDLGSNRYTNRLLQVADNAGYTKDDHDDWGDIQGSDTQHPNAGQDTDNYAYDGIGNLIKDDQEEIDSIAWTVYGKVWKVYRKETSAKPDLEFVYDAAGNRVIKKVIPKNSDTVTVNHYIRDASGNCMGIYKEHIVMSTQTTMDLNLIERSIYGSSRVGLNTNVIDVTEGTDTSGQGSYVLDYGSRQYELADHLGNVSVVLSGRRLLNTYATDFTANVLSANEYYPFGMVMPNRSFSSESYRYGFNGQEKDDEVKGNGNSLNYKYRMHDPRIGRFFAVDPLATKYPFNSPYAFGENTPIAFIELEGLEKAYYMNRLGFYIEGENDVRGFEYVGNVKPDKQPYMELEKSKGVLFHKNTKNILASGLNKANAAMGGSPTWWEERKQYDQAEESFNEMLVWTAEFYITGIAIGRLGKGVTSLLKGAGNSIWKLPAIGMKSRGFVYEKMLGIKGLMKTHNFPVIDAFYKGVATSVKTLDIYAKKYLKDGVLKSGSIQKQLTKYVDDLSKFKDTSWGGQEVLAKDITKKVLEVGIPRGASKAVQKEINAVIKYAEKKGVEMNVRVVK